MKFIAGIITGTAVTMVGWRTSMIAVVELIREIILIVKG